MLLRGAEYRSVLSASASAVVVSIETAAAAEQKDDPQTAVVAAEAAAKAVAAASAAAAEQKNDPQAGRHAVAVVASASTVCST